MHVDSCGVGRLVDLVVCISWGHHPIYFLVPFFSVGVYQELDDL